MPVETALADEARVRLDAPLTCSDGLRLPAGAVGTIITRWIADEWVVEIDDPNAVVTVAASGLTVLPLVPLVAAA